MALTRQQIEAVLISRCGPLMTEAGLDGTSMAGSNTDLNDPIASTLLKMGLTPTTISNIVDADLFSLAGGDVPELIDRAELRLLETVSSNLVYVNIQIGPRREDLAMLAEQVEKRIMRLSSKVQKEYGVGIGSLSAGMIGLDFQSNTDDGPIIRVGDNA